MDIWDILRNGKAKYKGESIYSMLPLKKMKTQIKTMYLLICAKRKGRAIWKLN